MDIKMIEDIARVIAGDHVGWQARFADAVGISRSHLSNVLKGNRPVTADLRSRLMVACIDQGAALRVRAQWLEKCAQELKLVEPATLQDTPRKYTREQYEADTEEAMRIIDGLVAGSAEGEEPDA